MSERRSQPPARVALVTGASGAIGEAIASAIAAAPGFEVVLLCRDEARAKRTAARVQREAGHERVRYELADVSSAQSVRALRARWRGPLHVLVNNACIAPRRRMQTREGLELQFATNVMGYLWMMLAFADALAACAPARIVNVASYWAGDLDPDDLQFLRRRYDNDTAYRQSKQADRMLSAALAARLGDRGIAVNSCHPGDVSSRLSHDLGFGGFESPAQAADTPAWLATSDEAAELNGRYVAKRRAERCRFSEHQEQVRALFERCLRHAEGLSLR